MFLVFGGEDYYPGGGINDFLGGFKTMEEAYLEASNCEWWTIHTFHDDEFHLVCEGRDREITGGKENADVSI